MATILQINRINTNRAGAVSDTVTRLQSATGTDIVNINAQHIPNLPASQINSGTLDVARIPNISADMVTSGQLNADRLNLGSGLVNMNGQLVAPAVNLTDVRTFASTTARNSEATVEWHEGDVAIVTAETMVMVPGGFEDTTRTVLLGGGAANEIRVSGIWDVAAGEAIAGFEDGAIIRFTNDGGATFRGSAAGGSGTDFTITAVRQNGPGANAIVTLDRTPNANDGIDNGDAIFAQTAPPTTVTQPLGTYVYTGTDQTAAGVTDNDDWTLLINPASTNIDAGSIVSGTLSNDRLDIYDSTSNREGIVTSSDFSVADGMLTVPTSGGDVTFRGGSTGLSSAETPAIAQTPATTGVTQNAQNEVTGITAAVFSVNQVALTTFPTSFMLFGNGIKIASSEITVNSGRTAATFDTGITFPAGGTLTFEIISLA